MLIDTPGMRELQLWDSGEAAAGSFADIEERRGQLPVPRLPASRAEPGCAVRAAVEAVSCQRFRLESYHKLQGEQAHQARQQDERAQIEEKRRGEDWRQGAALTPQGQGARLDSCVPPLRTAPATVCRPPFAG